MEVSGSTKGNGDGASIIIAGIDNRENTILATEELLKQMDEEKETQKQKSIRRYDESKKAYNEILNELKRNKGKLEFGKLSQNLKMDPKELYQKLNELSVQFDKIEIRRDSNGYSNKLIMLKKNYRLFSKIVLSTVITIILIYLLGPENGSSLNLGGMVFGIAGAISLTIGSLDNFHPIIDITTGQKLRIRLKNLRLLGQEDYYYMDQTVSRSHPAYPILRLTAAEFGPWFLLIGFSLQLCASLNLYSILSSVFGQHFSVIITNIRALYV